MKKLVGLIWAAATVASLTLATFAAGNDNPQTGDTSGRLIWIFIAIAIIAAVVVTIIGVTSSKKGKKK